MRAWCVLLIACGATPAIDAGSNDAGSIDAGSIDGGPPALDPREITAPTPLLDDEGSVVAHGWARGALMEYDRAAVATEHVERVREWEFYAIFAPTFAAAVTMTDVGIVTIASVSVQDYTTGLVHDASILGGPDELVLPPSTAGTIDWTAENGFARTELSGETRIVELGVGAVDVYEDARVALSIDDTGESIAAVHTFEPEGLFFYENKRVGLTATGTIRIGETTWSLEDAYAVIDWGRGAWPERVQWDWAAASGTSDGHRVGINLGTVHGDDSRGTADAIVVDGVLHKMTRVVWTYDPANVLAPWRFTSDDGRLDLTLAPDFDESGGFDLGPRYAMNNLKAHGTFSGTVVLDDGTTLRIEGVRGAAEHVEIRW
jgi:hypothetical protein